MGVVLALTAALVAVVLVVAALLTGSAAAAVLAVGGPLLVVVSLLFAGWLLRHRVAGWAARRLVGIAGPAVVRSLPPRDVLSALFDRIFGEQVGHDEITTALLGGGGHDLAGFDIAVSRSTSISMTLHRIDQDSCLTEMTWSYEFAGVRDNHRLVMFTTANADIFRLLPSRRIYPLFESWLVGSDDPLDDYVPSFRAPVKAGISYRDEDGDVHTVEPTVVKGEDIALRDYEQFVRLPERMDRKELRIIQLDLYDLADPDHVVEAIERLTLRASTFGAFGQGFVTWSAPYPCFVDVVSFDVRQLAKTNEELDFQVSVYAIRTLSTPSLDWTHVPGEIKVPVHAWMLPGHGVTLLWRPVDGTESLHDLEQF